MSRFWRLFGVILSATIVIGLAMGNQSVQAVTTKAVGLTLSPLRSEFGMAPGTSRDGKLTVTNATDKPMTVRLSAEAFSVTNQAYDYAFTEESELTKWVSFAPDAVSLAPGKSQKVSYTVGVPLSAEPGGRYISLFASTDTDIPTDGVGSQQRIASLIYLTVEGDVTRIGRLLSLSSPWAIGSTSRWSSAIQNSGTTHFRSRYDVKLQSLFGNQTITTVTGDALILPGTVRAVADELPMPSLPGIYKFVYSIGLGDTPSVMQTRYVLYMPALAWLVILGATLIIATLIIHRKSQKR